MTAEWFDLGQRFRAAATGEPVCRLRSAAISAAPHPVAVRAWLTDSGVTVTATAPSVQPATATGRDALALLGTLGVTVAAPVPATLVTDQPGTLELLHRLARTAGPDDELDAIAAHISWWRDRADFPGGGAVVDTTAACRARWVTGLNPAAERHAVTWRQWLGAQDDSVRGLLDLHARLAEGTPLRWLDTLAADDVWAYGQAQSEHSDGLDWRRPDSTSRAALGLRSRCDASDLYAAALLTDPLYRLRAVHTGHVVTGTAHPLGDKLRRVEISAARLDARLRPGNDVTGWAGSPASVGAPFAGTVTEAAVRAGQLLLTLTGVTGVGGISDGQTVTLMPAAPSPERQRAARKTYRALYTARRSWLTTGRSPTATRRPVPLDVLVGGAARD